MGSPATREKANPENTSHYLECLRANRITPNFWTSAEYIIRSEADWVHSEGLEGFQQEEGEWVIPPLNSDGSPITAGVPIFAGWPMDKLQDPSSFLDFQFIYDPADFLHMEGRAWQTFRKNIRKYPQRSAGVLAYHPLPEDLPQSILGEFITQWAAGREVYEPDTLVRFVLYGDNRRGLWLNDRLVGINVWDANYQFVNFRYCIDDGSPFLNEYLRYLFYTDSEIQQVGRMVNDGGSLGSEALYRFKCKLNPQQILMVYSYGRQS